MVSPEKGIAYCFGCHQGGDIFKFVELIENVNFSEAVKILAEKTGVALPKDIPKASNKRLKGIEIGGAVVPRAIDEFPVISVAAACAEGQTVIRDAEELRVKETDRIAAMVEELSALGGRIESTEDGMIVDGVEQLTGGAVKSHGDHRIAMSTAVAALAAAKDVSIADTGCTETSFPGFWQLLQQAEC